MRKRTYSEAKAHYRQLRLAVYARVGDTFVDAPRLRLTEIDARALSAWQRQWRQPHPSGSGGWDWAANAGSFRRDPADFTLAIWSGSILCGLASGRASGRGASGGRSAISIYNVESNPDRLHPLKGKIALIATTVAEAYGFVIDARAVRLVDPLPGALHIYVKLGFTVAWKNGRAVYCEREVLR